MRHAPGSQAWPNSAPSKPVEPATETQKAPEVPIPAPLSLPNLPLASTVPSAPAVQPLGNDDRFVAQSQPRLRVLATSPSRTSQELATSDARSLEEPWLYIVFVFQGLVFLGLLWALLQQQRTVRELMKLLAK